MRDGAVVSGHEREGRGSVEFFVDGTRRLSLTQGLREVWAFREVTWALAERNVRLKYKQAELGIAWAVIQPLAFLSIFVILFGRLTHVSGGGVSYPAFSLSVLVPWTFLQTAVSFGAAALLTDAGLIRKIYFPREASVLGAVLGTGLDFAVGLGLLLTLGPFLGTRLSWTILLAAPLWVVTAVLASGLAMGLGALNVYYRDFRYALPLFIQLWMFASPVAYPLTTVPHQWRTLYVVANPAAGILDGFRRIFAQGQVPDLGLLMISTGTTFIIAWLGYLVFKRMEPGFADSV